MKPYHFYLTLLTALAGVITCVYVYAGFRQMETARIVGEFQTDVERSATSIEREVRLNFEALHGLHNLFDNGREVTAAEFAQASQDVLSRHSDIQALEWIPRVPHARRAEFVASRRGDLPQYEITERQRPGLMIEALERDEYYPVSYRLARIRQIRQSMSPAAPVRPGFSARRAAILWHDQGVID